MTTELEKIGTWKVVRRLSGGGQGLTYMVERDGVTGVAKIIIPKYKDSIQARQRMHREVVNMKWLAERNLRVPQWLDDNTDLYESLDEDLFFVMSFLKGRTLDKYVAEEKINAEKAITLTENLIETLRAAFSEQIIHRDIKPENIIVDDNNQIFVLDFGVSFNQVNVNTTQVTRVDETIVNLFLMLPERSMHGEDKRNVISDITGVCGVLYYLVSKLPPKTLLDEKGLMPHERSGGEIKIVDNKLQSSQLNKLLDVAFQYNMRDRFQSYDELIDRLNFIKGYSMNDKKRNPIEMARVFNDRLNKSDRVTIKQEINKKSKSISVQLTSHVNKIRNEMPKFSLSNADIPYEGLGVFLEIGSPSGEKPVSLISIVSFDFQHVTKLGFKISYIATVSEDLAECKLHRRVTKYKNSKYTGRGTEWEVIDIYKSDAHASEEIIVDDLNERVADCIEEVESTILG